MFSSSQMSHGLLGDISMIAAVPRRNQVPKESGAPPRLSEQAIYGTPPKPPPRPSKSALRRLNQLEKTCYIGVHAGAEAPPEKTPQTDDEGEGDKPKAVWMGSGYMQQKRVTNKSKPKIGDGSGDGHEERSPIQPWFFNTDSDLLERRRVQSTVQCFSRTLRDHNRAPLPPHRQPGNITPGLESTEPPESATTFVQPHPQSPSPPLGKTRRPGSGLRLRSQSSQELRPSWDTWDSESEPEQMVYARHYGTRADGSATRNWPNEEFGIFPGSGQSSGALKNYSTKKAREYTSLSTLMRDKLVNHRSTISLPEKYRKPVTEAQRVGWDLAEAEWHDNQQFPRMRCYFTAYDQDLKKGGVQDQLVLRRLGMKC